jgi:hypothetical protein
VEPPEEQAAFSIADVLVRCSYAPEHAAIVRAFVDGPLRVGSSRRVVEVTIRGSSGDEALSPGEVQTCTFGDVRGYSPPGKLTLLHGTSSVVASLDGTDVVCRVGRGTVAHLAGAVMLFVGTAVALRAHGLFHLHAACVGVPDVGTVLIVGESGSGKTTLSIALATLGGTLVTDDAVFLRESDDGGALEAHGWPGQLHVTRETLVAFPSLAAAARSTLDGRDKVAVPVAAVGRPLVASAREPTVVLFPKVGDAPTSSLRGLDATETVAGLIPQSGLAAIPGVERAGEHLRLLASLASRAQGFEIRLGRDVLVPTGSLLDLLRRTTRR